FFFFQAEDGIRDLIVTGVQTCALPILAGAGAGGILMALANPPLDLGPLAFFAAIPLLWALRGVRARRGALLGLAFGLAYYGIVQIGRASCRERGWISVSAVELKKKTRK